MSAGQNTSAGAIRLFNTTRTASNIAGRRNGGDNSYMKYVRLTLQPNKPGDARCAYE